MHMATRTMVLALAVLGLLVASSLAAEEPNAKLLVTRAARKVDLSSQLVKKTAEVTLLNEGETAVGHFLYTVDGVLAPHLAYITAQVKGKKNQLQVTDTKLKKPQQGVAVYKITLPQSLTTSESVTVIVETIFTRAVKPHPQEITQAEKQLVQFIGNAYFYTPYRCKTQSSDFSLPSPTNVESYTRVAPVSSDGGKISYGPYSDREPFSHTRVVLHFENNGPFLSVVSLLRLIQVSHWGVIQVEEHLHIKHTGALLKGSFSRYDYQRNPNSGISSIKSFTTMLPAGARDVYYRDEIGNISTSHLREDEEYNELILRPRFPLFGGWQTRYYIGYNVPSYEYLFHSGSNFALRMRVVDHVFDNQIMDEVTVRVILPEGSNDIILKAPYPVEEDEMTLHHTYLDTVGRPVVQFRKQNLVEEHIQDFEIHYSFAMPLLLQEPLLMVGGLLLFFLLIIVVVRLDFSITKDPALLAKQHAAVMKESILLAADRRSALIKSSLSAIDSFKRSRDTKTFKSNVRSLSDKYVGYSDDVTALMKELQPVDSDGASKVNSLQKKASDIHDLLTRMSFQAEQVVAGKLTNQSYAKDDDSNRKRLNQLMNEAETLVQSL